MLPEAFMDRMKSMMGEEYEAFIEGLAGEKYRALRVNPLKRRMNGDGVSIEELPFTLRAVPWCGEGYYYEKENQPGKHPYHDAGLYYIQEPSAMAPAPLLAVEPGERVLDLCAAPGGKSTQLGAALKGRGVLISNEIHPGRARILSENVERMGIINAMVTNETPAHLAEVFPEYFDRILVDAPCSGEGMFRKNEEASKEWSLENVRSCALRQDEILDYADKMLRPGGRLVYSTCTFAPLENEGSISRFLTGHKDYRVLPIERGPFQKNAQEVPKVYLPEEEPGEQEEAQGEHWSENADVSLLQGTGEERLRKLEHTLSLWPHKVQGEGHYAAVLEKAGAPLQGFPATALNGVERGISKKELGEYPIFCQEALSPTGREKYGHPQEGHFLLFGENLYLIPEQLPATKGLKVLRPGLHIGTLKKNRFEPSHALALAMAPGDAARVWNLSSTEGIVRAYLRGETFPAQGDKGWYLICVDGYGIGWGKLAGGIMKNHYPKGLRRNY